MSASAASSSAAGGPGAHQHQGAYAAPGSSSGTNGAKPVADVGFRPQANMAVVPPRKEDLQKSYASIVGDDHNPAGWYGSMSMFISYPSFAKLFHTSNSA